MQISDTIRIDESEIEERYMRASGAGGQHVNKTETGIQLRLDITRNEALPEAAKRRLVRLAGSRLTKDGVLIIRCDEHRSRERNRADARARLKALLEKSLIAPKPRLKSRPSRASIQRQKQAKTARSQTKSLRQKPRRDD